MTMFRLTMLLVAALPGFVMAPRDALGQNAVLPYTEFDRRSLGVTVDAQPYAIQQGGFAAGTEVWLYDENGVPTKWWLMSNTDPTVGGFPGLGGMGSGEYFNKSNTDPTIAGRIGHINLGPVTDPRRVPVRPMLTAGANRVALYNDYPSAVTVTLQGVRESLQEPYQASIATTEVRTFDTTMSTPTLHFSTGGVRQDYELVPGRVYRLTKDALGRLVAVPY